MQRLFVRGYLLLSLFRPATTAVVAIGAASFGSADHVTVAANAGAAAVAGPSVVAVVVAAGYSCPCRQALRRLAASLLLLMPGPARYYALYRKRRHLVNTLEMMTQTLERRRRKRRESVRKRSTEEKAVIDQAKALLMERNHMSESEAHRYLQKNSMESGTNMLETAQMVLMILDE